LGEIILLLTDVFLIGYSLIVPVELLSVVSHVLLACCSTNFSFMGGVWKTISNLETLGCEKHFCRATYRAPARDALIITSVSR
jgi:hypothetical protein